jgi:F0F1-type ATP synthase assembly protein I
VAAVMVDALPFLVIVVLVIGLGAAIAWLRQR